MSSKVYNKWITKTSKVILQDVLVTLEGSSSVKLTYVDYEIDEEGNYKMVHGYPSRKILAYMNLPTMDIDKNKWHSEYADGKEPTKDGGYITCVEIREYGRTSYKLSAGHWRKDRFFGCNYINGEIIGWREFPKPFKSLKS